MTAKQDAPSVARQHVPEDFSSVPTAVVLCIEQRVEVSPRSTKAGVDGSAPDPGLAKDVDALPVDALIDSADGARSSGGEPRKMQRPVKPRPWIGRATCLDERKRPQKRKCMSRDRPGHSRTTPRDPMTFQFRPRPFQRANRRSNLSS